ncbi:hypothetical protein [Hyphomicrobium sp.]|uniref:hypothetical protein n=1 Tax=Hyphomicrobium sp. TaxID=82 RepID=UPI002E2FB883|nr:hypothetical protein [Hyphomicrobium sp.]HEX2843597.1 hypothetical protein [Hyphomicrobium sp.]
MFSRGGFEEKARRRNLPGSEAATVALSQANPDKALVMKYVGQLVADGYAEWDVLGNGEVEVRFTSGETYLLAETTILRLT